MLAERITPWNFSGEGIGKISEEKDPDIPTHEQKELSECDKIINYLVYRMSLGDFEVEISTATGKLKGCNDAHLSTALMNLLAGYRMTEGNIEVNARIGTCR